MIRYAIVGHVSRAVQCAALQRSLNATLFLDDGTLGEWANHARALTWGAEAHDDALWADSWLVVLQDDAQPVPDFKKHVSRALTNVPRDAALVSFYTGTSRPLRSVKPFDEAIMEAELTGAGFLTASRLCWGVAVAIRSSHLRALLDFGAKHSQPYDERLSAFIEGDPWLGSIYYTWPSLVDHEDGSSLVRHAYDDDSKPRKARKVGLPRSWNVTQVNI
ncbi:hypothetical protein [Gryllotalpicola koreensis]|uniref:Glycosyltransferase n=1 Tax=Gryllotalpicola koreensis TaxID=993086 RepID=A0ABP8A1T7_9MICO